MRSTTKLTAATLIAMTVAIPALAQDAPPKPAWTVTENTTPLTGATSIAAQLDSSNDLQNMLGRPAKATLVLRCQDRVMAAYVSWPQVLQITGTTFGGANYQTMVLWKLDQGQIMGNSWDRSTDGIAAGKFTTGGATKVIAKLYTAKQLVVRMTGTATQDAVFDLGDVQPVATRVGKACGVTWSVNK